VGGETHSAEWVPSAGLNSKPRKHTESAEDRGMTPRGNMGSVCEREKNPPSQMLTRLRSDPFDPFVSVSNR
jgi:hypothetical protein